MKAGQNGVTRERYQPQTHPPGHRGCPHRRHLALEPVCAATNRVLALDLAEGRAPPRPDSGRGDAKVLRSFPHPPGRNAGAGPCPRFRSRRNRTIAPWARCAPRRWRCRRRDLGRRSRRDPGIEPQGARRSPRDEGSGAGFGQGFPPSRRASGVARACGARCLPRGRGGPRTRVTHRGSSRPARNPRGARADRNGDLRSGRGCPGSGRRR